jgi:hypothetical protein
MSKQVAASAETLRAKLDEETRHEVQYRAYVLYILHSVPADWRMGVLAATVIPRFGSLAGSC